MAKTPKRTFDHIVFGALVSGAAAGAPVDPHALAGLATPAPRRVTGGPDRDNIPGVSHGETGVVERDPAGGPDGAIPGVRLLGGVLPEKKAAQTFLNRWLRRGLLAGFGVGFTVPYLAILNDVHVEGDEVLKGLPRRNVVFLANHQTYFLEALTFFDLVYVRHQFPLEDPVLRFSAAEETMKKNLLTKLMGLAGGVTFRRSFREGGVDVARPVDMDGVARVEEAIREGWLLHFPAGTTKKGAPLRSGVSRLLHNTKAVALPLRVDGFRDLLLHKQLPGKLFKRCSLKIHPPLDLDAFYAKPYNRADGARLLRHLEDTIGDGEQ